MPLGIRPIIDYPFKKTFGSPENKACLTDKVHHAFRLTDAESGRVMGDTIEVHTLELSKYNKNSFELNLDDMLDCWLFWLLHAQDYDAGTLLKLLPQTAIRQATHTIERISLMTEDKMMFDACAKAIRDRKWDLEGAYHDGEKKGKLEGKLEGEIKLIRMLQDLLNISFSDERELASKSLEQLEAVTANLRDQLRSRKPS